MNKCTVPKRVLQIHNSTARYETPVTLRLSTICNFHWTDLIGLSFSVFRIERHTSNKCTAVTLGQRRLFSCQEFESAGEADNPLFCPRK